MLHGDFQLQKVLPKINVARKLNVKKSCNEESLRVLVLLVQGFLQKVSADVESRLRVVLLVVHLL